MPDDQAVDDIGAEADSLTVTVPLTQPYANPYVNVSPTEVEISIPLVSGPSSTTTEVQVVGTLTNFQNPNLMATLTVWSEYDPEYDTLTVCGNELESPDSTCLSTYPEGGEEQTCRQHSYAADTDACGDNPNWNYCVGDWAPGLMEVFQSSTRAANAEIAAAALAQGHAVITRTPPPTLSAELAEEFRFVLRDGVPVEFFDPEKDYGRDIEVGGIESVWYGTIELDPTDYFANVIGSTGDPKIAGKNWLPLWQNQFGPAVDCTSRGFMGFVCGGSMVGGHVILGKTAKTVATGSMGVFIMPICNDHNMNDKVYMAPVVYKEGIALQRYFEKGATPPN